MNYSTAKLCFIFFFCLAGLNACFPGRAVQLYSGPELGADEIATVVVPGGMQLISVSQNGDRKELPITSAGRFEVKLAPGRYDFEMRYFQAWTASSGNFVDVRSKPITLNRQVKAGEWYELRFQPPSTYQDAKQLAKAFTVDFVEFKAPTKEQLAKAQLASVQVPTSDANTKSPTKARSDVESMSLASLKYWWSQASSEERYRFEQWKNAHTE